MDLNPQVGEESGGDVLFILYWTFIDRGVSMSDLGFEDEIKNL